MIRLLEGNPVGIALAATIGGLVFCSLILGLIWALPPMAESDEVAGEESALVLEIPELPESEPIERYAVITERPAFNQSRQPQLAAVSEEDLEEEQEEEIDAPELKLAGVVITPSLRMATLKQPEDEGSLVAFEGQPLEGDYGSWHISKIEARQVTLSSGTGQQTKLALEVHKEAIAEPPKPKPRSREDAGSDEELADVTDTDEDRPMTRAEEIRQRIAERREELRRAAEAEEAEQAAEAEQAGEASRQEDTKPVNYRSAINAMIRSKNQTGNQENEQ